MNGPVEDHDLLESAWISYACKGFNPQASIVDKPFQ